MEKDPLTSNLPLSNDKIKAINQLIEILGYSPEVFQQLLKSLLIEELLDRLLPSQDEIRSLRLLPNHLQILKNQIDERTKVDWPMDTIKAFWDRIRLLDSDHKRAVIPLSKKLQVLVTRKQECSFCKKKPPEVQLHIDHIYAASKGGPNELWNLRLLCSTCNLKKSNHLDWRILCL